MNPQERGQGKAEHYLNQALGISKQVAETAKRTSIETRKLFTVPTDIELADKLTGGSNIKDVVWVPCSITDTIQDIMVKKGERGEINYYQMVNEHSLAGVAAGIYLATGRNALIHMQNSGLPNAADGIISFGNVYKIPIPAIVTYRGNNLKDDSEPHQEIGNITSDLTRVIFKGHVHGDRLGRGIIRATERMAEEAGEGQASVLKLAPEAFKKAHPIRLAEGEFDVKGYEESYRRIRQIHGEASNPINSEEPITREEALRDIRDACESMFGEDTAIVVSNGYNSRAAQATIDRVGNFYNVGYMGGSLALGWGMAKSNPDMNFVVVDGDQNAMMGKMHEILAQDYPDNLQWIIVDNRFGTSVGVARSPSLPPWYYDLAWVVNTIPEEPGSFKHPRVGKRGAYFDDDVLYLESKVGPLPYHAERFKNWVLQKTKEKRSKLEFRGKFGESLPLGLST